MMSEWLGLACVAAASGHDQRPVAWRDGQRIARAQFLRDVANWQVALASHPGQRFALSFDKSYDFAAALFGAWQAGKQVFLPGDTQAATLARLAPLVDGWLGDVPDALGPMPAMPPGERSASPALAELDRQTTSLVIYTSGTNGEPLAIAKKLAQLDAEAHALQAAFGAGLDACPDAGRPAAVYSTVSHQHIYGLLFSVLWPLAAGRPFVSERLAYPEEMAQRLAGAPSVLVSSPAHLNRLPDTLDWRAAQSKVVAIFSSGGPLTEAGAAASLALLGQSPREVYGSSETGGVAWRQRAVHGERWTPLPGVAWRVDGDLLSVRSAHLGDEQWFATSDLAVADGAGGFTLRGRADRIVKVEEKRVSLTAIEVALAACPELEAARVFMLATSAGPKLAVVAVPSAEGWSAFAALGKRGLSERLRQSLLAVVERLALPRRWRYVRAMPVNAQGKSTEALLANLFRPLQPSPVWTIRTANEARVTLAVTADLAVFDGHFDGVPVLAGVAQLGWAIDMARSCFALPPGFQRVEALKFQRPVRPPVALQLSLGWRSDTSQLTFQFTSAAGTHSSGRVVFGAEA